MCSLILILCMCGFFLLPNYKTMQISPLPSPSPLSNILLLFSNMHVFFKFPWDLTVQGAACLYVYIEDSSFIA